MLHEGLGSVDLWGDFPDKIAAATGAGVFVYSRAGYGKSTGAKLLAFLGLLALGLAAPLLGVGGAWLANRGALPPFTGDYTGAFQWQNRTLQPFEQLVRTVRGPQDVPGVEAVERREEVPGGPMSCTPVTTAVLGPGSLLGEMGIVDGEPRSATCTATADLRCAILTREAMEQLMQDHPAVGGKLMMAICQRIASRMRDTSEKLKLYSQLTQAMQQEIDRLMLQGSHPVPYDVAAEALRRVARDGDRS